MMAKSYSMSKECDKFLRYALEYPGMDKPVAVDDAYDLLRSLGRVQLSRICDTKDPEIKDKLTDELNIMEQNNVGPWITIVLGMDDIKLDIPLTDVIDFDDDDEDAIEAAQSDFKAEFAEELDEEEEDDDDEKEEVPEDVEIVDVVDDDEDDE